MVFPNDSEDLIRIVRSDGWACFASLDDDFNELGFVFSVGVQRKPVVEVLATNTPTMIDTFSVIQSDSFYF